MQVVEGGLWTYIVIVQICQRICEGTDGLKSNGISGPPAVWSTIAISITAKNFLPCAAVSKNANVNDDHVDYFAK